jgi:Zn-dependent M28 family amino/carboxypeptidase
MFSSRTLQVSTTFASATALLCLSIGVGKISGGESAKAAASAPTMSAARIAAHVKFLASDLLEGRGTGQRGGDIAAEYIGTQFAAYGLQPAGDDGAYYQSVPMVSVKTLPSTSFKLVPKSGDAIELKNLDDFVTNSESQDESVEIDAPIVFIGYGIAAPEYKWDDYKGVDLKGKVALVFVNEPSSDDPKFFKGKALTYYGRWTYKFEETARRGAVATLIIHRTDLASYGWPVVRNSWGSEREYLKREASTPAVKAASWIQLDIAKKLAIMSGQDLDKLFAQAQTRDFKPVELPVRLQAHVASELRPFTGRNVVARLQGSDAKRASEAVLYTAHYDHLGIDTALKGDNIYNGAVDNGTGCGILLELAHAWSIASPPPRSILFAAVTGEEQGLLGSEYLGKHPPIPASKISVDLNFDALRPIGIPEEVEVSGAERTTFYPAVESAAKKFGLTIRPDAHPENGYYYRSDHFSLAHVGIPSFSIDEGLKYKDHDAAWGEEQAKDYTDHHYHQPSDEFDPKWDFAGLAEMTRFGFELGQAAANQPQLQGWQHGDEFEAARKQASQ